MARPLARKKGDDLIGGLGCNLAAHLADCRSDMRCQNRLVTGEERWMNLPWPIRAMPILHLERVRGIAGKAACVQRLHDGGLIHQRSARGIDQISPLFHRC